MRTLNIFFQEPNPDRWLKFDRYPRQFFRRLLRGKEKPGSIMMIALNLMKGLDILKIPYRFNDFEYIKNNPQDVACIIGKPQLLEEHEWINPIVFGAGIFSHPSVYPDLLKKHQTIKKILVPGPWVKNMFTPFYGEGMVNAWPVGIDTEKWKPKETESKNIDFLVYSKFLWDKEQNKTEFLIPLLNKLSECNLSFELITYGAYTHEDLQDKISRCKAAIFLCEHETQGMAYQQILSSNLPILAWDREDYWLDPTFYPEKVQFSPTSSVPYWTDQCGVKFKNLIDFDNKLVDFLEKLYSNVFEPRKYIVTNLSLERCAKAYVDIISSVYEDTANR